MPLNLPAVAVYWFHLVFHFLPVAPSLQCYFTVAAGVRAPLPCKDSGSFASATNSRQISTYSLQFTQAFSQCGVLSQQSVGSHSQISTIMECAVGQCMHLKTDSQPARQAGRQTDRQINKLRTFSHQKGLRSQRTDHMFYV